MIILFMIIIMYFIKWINIKFIWTYDLINDKCYYKKIFYAIIFVLFVLISQNKWHFLQYIIIILLFYYI